MPTHDDCTTEREERYHEAVASYLQALDAGGNPDRRQWLDRYADVAPRLAAYFADHDRLIAARKTPSPEAQRTKASALLEEFIRQAVKPGRVIGPDVEATIKHWIAEIDQKLSAQLNEVMHHPDFQKLEGTWRGLHYLVRQTETGENLKLRVLNVTKRELFRDLERAVEFDQSTLFKKVYEEEYASLGGQPYGLLVGDYEFDQHPEDVSLLKMISAVAAVAHAPFVAAAAPKMFGFDRFTELAAPLDLGKIFSTVEYVAWNSFRESEDARYVALTLPRVLARPTYGANFKQVGEFNFDEFIDGRNHDKYLWASAAWAYAARVTDAFAMYGWLARTRGVEAGGKVEGLPVHTFPTDNGGVAMKCPTEIAIDYRREFELSNLGFLPLLHAKERDFAVFMGAESCHKPKCYADPEANANAALSSKLNYLLCASRFAHYLMVMAHDRIGAIMEVKDCECWLNQWIGNYVLSNPANISEEAKARLPLADAKVEVRAVKGKPGRFEMVIWLRFHLCIGFPAFIRLVAEIPNRRG
jgi:type VI secretion system protein ImpC